MIASTAERLSRTVRSDVRSMHAYAVQPSAGLVKLDAMENPFRLPATLRRALGERLAEVAINRYPGDEQARLRDALAEHIRLPAGCSLVLGNGSDELISMLALACDVEGATTLAPLPGFVMYAMAAQLQGLGFVGVPLDARFDLDLDAMLHAIETHRPAITWLAYPNNPTANLFDDAKIDRIVGAIGRQHGFVVFDEAYQPFASRSRLADAGRHPHVLVLRTLSKFGLAGVRLGYLVGPTEAIQAIDKVRPPYNVSVLNAEAALFAIEHADEYDRQAAQLRDEREKLLEALAAMPGAEPFPSQANMVLVRVADAPATFAALKAAGVLVKNVQPMHPLLGGCLRLTVGAPEENRRMLDALAAALA